MDLPTAFTNECSYNLRNHSKPCMFSQIKRHSIVNEEVVKYLRSTNILTHQAFVRNMGQAFFTLSDFTLTVNAHQAHQLCSFQQLCPALTKYTLTMGALQVYQVCNDFNSTLSGRVRNSNYKCVT